jgi:hypothetical protein
MTEDYGLRARTSQSALNGKSRNTKLPQSQTLGVSSAKNRPQKPDKKAPLVEPPGSVEGIDI